MHRADVPLKNEIAEAKPAIERGTQLQGMWAAKPLLAAPALIALPIMLAFGEGDYIVPILGFLWSLCAIYGNRMRLAAPPGSTRRFTGFWVCLWSTIGALAMFAVTAAFIADGVWRWTAPAWWSLV